MNKQTSVLSHPGDQQAPPAAFYVFRLIEGVRRAVAGPYASAGEARAIAAELVATFGPEYAVYLFEGVR